MKTNSLPYSDQAPGATPDNTRVGNFYYNDNIANGYNDGYAVTGSGSTSSSQNYLTDVGAYASSPSYYGTFDQGGNVEEWTEASYVSLAFPPPAPPLYVYSRGSMGGDWFGGSGPDGSAARHSPGTNSEFELQYIGFRVVSVSNVGNYNLDNKVDAADYVVWRKNNGSVAQYNIWRANFGSVLAGTGSAAVVPEPIGSLLLTIAAIFCFLVSSRSYRVL